MVSSLKQLTIAVILCLILLALQGNLENLVGLYAHFVPLAILPLIIFISFIFDARLALLACFIIGIIYDLYASELIGPGGGAFLITSCVINLLIESIILDSVFNQAILGFISALCALTSRALLAYQNEGFNIDSHILTQSVASAIFCPFAISILLNLSQYIGLKKDYGKSSYI